VLHARRLLLLVALVLAVTGCNRASSDKQEAAVCRYSAPLSTPGSLGTIIVSIAASNACITAGKTYWLAVSVKDHTTPLGVFFRQPDSKDYQASSVPLLTIDGTVNELEVLILETDPSVKLKIGIAMEGLPSTVKVYRTGDHVADPYMRSPATA
jgi:hypothetical protein